MPQRPALPRPAVAPQVHGLTPWQAPGTPPGSWPPAKSRQIVPDAAGQFRLKVWQTSNPAATTNERLETHSDWAGLPWTLPAQAHTGTLDGSGAIAWTYDLHGQMRRECKAITASGSFRSEWGYTTTGAVAWMKYPADNLGYPGEKVLFDYYRQGSLNSLYSETASYYYVQQAVYDASGSFRSEWGYTTTGAVAWMKYPADNAGYPGEKVLFDYYRQGSLNSLFSETASYYYVQQAVYDASGRPDYRNLGAASLAANPAAKNAYTYNPWNTQGGRLQSLVLSKNGSTTILQNLSYAYDNVGNVLSVLDTANGEQQKQCFGYDALSRLTSAKVGGNNDTCSGTVGSREYADETYTYNTSTGNLASKTGMGNYTYDTTHKHAVASTNTGWSYQYDANGNMLRRDPPGNDYYDFSYDAENRIYRAQKNGAEVAAFVYDGDGKRVKSIQGSVTTGFVGEYLEWTGSTSTMVKYYLAGSDRVAMRTGAGTGTSGLKLLLGDHLGSTSVTVNAADLADVVTQLYRPWGEAYYSTATFPTKYTYTGQYSYTDDFATKDVTEGFGLMYYRARWYDTALGRFNQPDTIVPMLGQGVQAWDRYAYVNNNPILLTDSSGHCASFLGCLSAGFSAAADLVGQASEASKEVINTADDFLTGVGLEVLNNHSWATPGQTPYAASSSESDAMLVGRIVGDVTSEFVGAVEIVGGVGAVGTGAAACGTGVLCVAGAPAMAAGSAAISVGVITDVTAAGHMGENLAMLASNDTTSAGSNSLVENIFDDPSSLSGKTPSDIPAVIDEARANGWEIGTLGKGSHAGQGLMMREVVNRAVPE